MLYTVEHQKIESTIAGPYSVVVFKHGGPRPNNRTAFVASTVTGSCEMLVVLPSGADDVLTAYRFSQEDLVQKLLCYLEVMGEAAANI